jgi:AhpC/TSA family
MAINTRMRSYILSFLLCISFLLITGRVLAINGRLYFKGHIVSDQDTIRLRVALARNPITGYGENENEQLDIKVDRNGNFSFTFAGITGPSRLTLWDSESSVYILSYAVAEPGDSIVADLAIHADANGLELNASFSGTNAIKYTCAHELDAHMYAELAMIQSSNRGRVLALADSILKVKMDVLARYRKEMSDESYRIVKCDILGSVYQRTLEGLCGYAEEAYSRVTSELSAAAAKVSFDSVSAFVDKDLNGYDIGMSRVYMNFLYERTLWEYFFQLRGDEKFSFPLVCSQIVREYRGPLRDHLLAFALLDDLDITGAFNVVDCQEYTNCLRMGVKVIGTPWIRNAIAGMVSGRGVGQEAFDFTLPADSSGKLVSLRSLRGKIVLVDMWGYQCTGCSEFAQAFHKAVYPLFKDDSNFRVVSILESLTPYNLYLYRLRSTPQPGLERLSPYTYPDYINLFGGKGEYSGRLMAKHYNYATAPFVILIDKQGKIYSSTLPLFTDSQSENVSKLVQMIKEALREKS